MREPESRYPQILSGLWIAFVAQRPEEARAANLRTAPPEVWDIDGKATPVIEEILLVDRLKFVSFINMVLR